MDQTLFTPRLKLSLITTAERGSQELEWLHELRSDEKATWWRLVLIFYFSFCIEYLSAPVHYRKVNIL